MKSDNSLNIKGSDYWNRVYDIYTQMCMAQFDKLENDNEIIKEDVYSSIRSGNRSNNIQFYKKSFTLAKDIVEYFDTVKQCTTPSEMTN